MAKKPRKKTGRSIGRPRTKPRVDDPIAIALVCKLLAEGNELYNIGKRPDCPNASDIYARMAEDASFGMIIARAREAQQHALADECRQLAERATAETWQVQRLKIATIQWRAGKLAPKTYGDVGRREVTGKDGGPIDFRNLTTEQIAAIIADHAAGDGDTPVAGGTGKATDSEPEC